jgi:hypothetical protein
MASQGSSFGGFTVRTGYLLALMASALGCGGSVTLMEEDAAGASRGGTSSDKTSPKLLGSGSTASDGGSPDTSGGTGIGGTTPSSGGGPAGGDAPVAAQSTQYPGHGFVVHEWGTDTIVVGSDGSLQRGLHHEEEDLPEFVYDRLKAAPLSPLSVLVKMETPVTYFYSDVPLSVQASVAFPEGLLTQWYPAVSRFAPEIAAPGSVTSPTTPAAYADPVLDPSFPFGSDMCRDRFSSVAGGKLDWGTFTLLPRGTDVSAGQPEAPLAKFGWSYARDVDANPIQMPNGEAERFLFYRGLGDFDFPITVQAGGAGHVALTNGYNQPVGRVFVLNVGAEKGAFIEHRAGIAPGATLDEMAPSLDAAPSLDDYAQRLGSAVTDALDATGLYHDEAMAMVNTWQRQWFRTPGVRVLYLIPQAWTDASIPLTITPKPETLLRVMLIRVEVITPEQEASDVNAAKMFDIDSAQAKAHFAALGRFEEPRLRRALSLSATVAGEEYLGQIRTASTAVASGE